jgi:predicted transcriptional regulator
MKIGTLNTPSGNDPGMVWWSRAFFILLVAVTLASLAIPGTATARYVVEPVTEEYPGEMYDLDEITFWNLPLRVMLVHCMLMVMPACLCPCELLYLFTILVPLGFRRVTKHTVLDDDFRLDLYRRIAVNPGAGTAELRELTGASRGQLRYHLDMLIREGKVATVDYRNRARHFVRSQRHTDLEQRILANLRDETPGTILAHHLRNPGSTRNDITEWLGLSGPTVIWQMQQFEAEGIVTADREERATRYRLTEDTQEFLNRYTGDPSIARHPSARWDLPVRRHEVLSG